MPGSERESRAREILYGEFPRQQAGAQSSEGGGGEPPGGSVSVGPPVVNAAADSERTKAARQRTLGLAIVGCLFIGFGIGLWIAGGDPGAGKTTVATSGIAVDPPGVTTTSEKTTTVSGTAGPSETVEKTDQTAGPTTTITTADPGPDGTRSADLSIALIGLGAGLLVLSAFFNRIAKVTFPGGFAIELTPEQVADIVKPALATAPAQAKEPQVVAQQVLQAVQAIAPSPYVTVPTEFVDAAVAAIVEGDE